MTDNTTTEKDTSSVPSTSSNEPTLLVTFKTRQSQSHELTVKSSDTFASIVDKLKEAFGWNKAGEVWTLKFIYSGKVVQSHDHTFEQYGVKNKTFVVVLQQLQQSTSTSTSTTTSTTVPVVPTFTPPSSSSNTSAPSTSTTTTAPSAPSATSSTAPTTTTTNPIVQFWSDPASPEDIVQRFSVADVHASLIILFQWYINQAQSGMSTDPFMSTSSARTDIRKILEQAPVILQQLRTGATGMMMPQVGNTGNTGNHNDMDYEPSGSSNGTQKIVIQLTEEDKKNIDTLIKMVNGIGLDIDERDIIQIYIACDRNLEVTASNLMSEYL